MNAEIVNGTINTISEAVAWLSYTFLFVCMRRNPIAYGMTMEDLFADPQLEKRRIELVCQAAQTLDNCMMARYDIRSGNLAVSGHFFSKCHLLFVVTCFLSLSVCWCVLGDRSGSHCFSLLSETWHH